MISIGQVPSYFENNQEWACDFSFYSPGISDCQTNTSYSYYVNGDTIINSVNYKKIGKRSYTSYTQMQQFVECDEITWEDMPVHLIMRQSSDSIFIYNTQNGNDELFISYNLTVGDSFSLTSFVTNTYEVQDVTMTNINGQNHRVFHVDTLNDCYVIEGVGHITEGGDSEVFKNFMFGSGVDHTENLGCYAQDNNTVWTNPSGGSSCTYLHNLRVDNHINNDQFLLFPNPTSNIVNIESDYIINSVKIISSNGTVVLKKESSFGIKSVNVSDLSQGSYLIFIQDSQGYPITLRFQKK
jgi:hypothetical protein